MDDFIVEWDFWLGRCMALDGLCVFIVMYYVLNNHACWELY
jgi:hypothetical protein